MSVINFDSLFYSGCSTKYKKISCSQINHRNRITFGELAKLAEFPYFARIHIGGSLCGGTILNENHVLSAAHCFYTGEGKIIALEYIGVFVAEVDRQLRPNPNVALYQVKKLTIHPDFELVLYTNDVAVLTTIKTIKFSTHVSPVCLKKSTVPKVGMEGLVIGFGMDELGNPTTMNLKYARETIVEPSSDKCKPLKGDAASKYADLDPGEMCGFGGKSRALSGDSGDPFVLEHDRCSLLGVAIRAVRDNLGTPDDGTIFLNISYYYEWVYGESGGKNYENLAIVKQPTRSSINKGFVRPRHSLQLQSSYGSSLHRPSFKHPKPSKKKNAHRYSKKKNYSKKQKYGRRSKGRGRSSKSKRVNKRRNKRHRRSRKTYRRKRRF